MDVDVKALTLVEFIPVLRASFVEVAGQRRGAARQIADFDRAVGLALVGALAGAVGGEAGGGRASAKRRRRKPGLRPNLSSVSPWVTGDPVRSEDAIRE